MSGSHPSECVTALSLSDVIADDDIVALWICATCGAEYPDTATPPESCPICTDDRQWVPLAGQQWTTAAELAEHTTFRIEELEPDLYGILVSPAVGIGQRSLLLRTDAGNLLWEPSAYLDASMVEAVRQLGGVAAVTASHPHVAGAQVSWSTAFGGAPIHWNGLDRRWVQRPDPARVWWTDTAAPLPGLTLVQTGGHFPGSGVLHWASGAGGRGVLLTGDTLLVTPGQRSVSFMRSYPNFVPLPERLVHGIVDAIDGYSYDRIYGSFDGRVVSDDAQRIVRQSAQRYLGWLRDEIRDPDEMTARTDGAGSDG